MRLSLDAVDVSFGERRVFEGVDLTASSPASIAVMGPSGSGKSTLLSLVAGESAPDAGRIDLESDGPVRMAWILQSTPLLPRRTGIDNVLLGPLSTGMDRRRARERAHEAMGQLAVGHLASAPVYRLSGGERQRLAVARSMASSADLILADEPTASLDAESGSAVCDALVLAARGGALVIVATHDPTVAARCDRVLDVVSRGLRERL